MVIGILAHDNVSNALTPDDIEYADRFLRDEGYEAASAPAPDFAGQVKDILAVQNAVLLRAPGDTPIDFDHPREPKDLYESRSGLCYDRSRAIEKILERLGYTVRHAAVYSTRQTHNALVALLTPQIESHAVTEVETAQGWMLVDSNDRWIGLTRDGKPVDLEELQDVPGADRQAWATAVKAPLNEIFRDGEFTYVFGLYSRHGHFFPPYDALPDVNWGEAISQNLM